MNCFEMAGMESWASSIMLHELAEKLQRPAILKSTKISYISDKISTLKESNDKKSGRVALLPASSRLLDIDHFASCRVNAGH